MYQFLSLEINFESDILYSASRKKYITINGIWRKSEYI